MPPRDSTTVQELLVDIANEAGQVRICCKLIVTKAREMIDLHASGDAKFDNSRRWLQDEIDSVGKSVAELNELVDRMRELRSRMN